MIINSREIDKYIHELLTKTYDVELAEDDLEQVESLVLSKYNIKNEVVQYDYSDLPKLKNLKYCSMELLDITDEFIENINKLENLETLELSFCNLESDLNINGSVKNIILQRMNGDFFNLINNSNIEFIEIINSKEFDISLITKYIHLKNLYIYNSNIINSKGILDMPELERLKLDGSTLDDESIVEKINPQVSIQKKEVFLLADA